jgi:trans-L-3-hydroxyproline dehydratase
MRSRRVIHVIGCHAEGEVGDVIVGGVLPPPGATMYDRMRAMEADDTIRRFLLLEPRGSVARHLNLVVSPTRSDCDAGVIIMEPTEYVPMSGSNVMCTATVLLETGMVAMTEPETVLMIETPGGAVRIRASCRNGRCESVEIANVPCFVDRLDAPLEIAGYPALKVDIAYGGMFFASVDARALGFDIAPHEARDLASLGETVRRACRERYDSVHPENEGIRGVSIVQFAGPFEGAGKVSRNTCIVAPGRSDRSPTGTGTCARMAILHARGLMQEGDSLIHESIIGSRFTGRIAGLTSIAGRPAILPTVAGRAWITGSHQYYLDPSDPFPLGYVVGDTWGVTGTLRQGC